MRIALGSDHRGVEAVDMLARHLEAEGHHVDLTGRCDEQSCDYPDKAWVIGRAVAEGRADRGILVCGSGIGVCMAANKVDGVRAALVNDRRGAEMSRRHNDANVLCLAGDHLDEPAIEAIIDAWLDTPFEGGRHARRVEKMAAIERGEDPARTVAAHHT